MLNNNLLCFSIILAGLFVAINGATQTAELYFSPNAGMYHQDDLLTLEVRVNPNGTEAAMVFCFIQYSLDTMAFREDLSAVNTTVFDNTMFTADPVERAPGYISFPSAAYTTLTTPGTLVATLVFEIHATGEGMVSFLDEGLRKTEVTDFNFDEILLALSDAQFVFEEPVCTFHSADLTGDWQIDFTAALLLIQRFNNGGAYSCGTQADGYQAGTAGGYDCAPHDTDYNQNWVIDFMEMLRFVQFFNLGYHCSTGTVDGYAPGPPQGN